MLPMKKVLFVASLSFLFHASNAQDYVPFPTDSAYWKTTFISLGKNIFKTFDLSGDTLIGPLAYHKLYETSQEEIPIIDSITFYPRAYIGCTREENKIVYYLPSGTTQETIAYNFNLGIGDTVAGDIYPCPGLYFTIGSIDSVVLTNGTFRKRFNLITCGNATGYYVEGLGNNYGPLPFYGVSIGPGSYAPNLTCFEDHGIYLYPLSQSDCSILTNAYEIPGTTLHLSLYPNPFREDCIIDFGKIIQQGELRVMDNLGQTVSSKTISGKQQEIISAHELQAPGIYLLTFSERDNVISRKIIFQQ